MIHRQALFDSLFLVVFALHQVFAGDVVLAREFRRIEFEVIGSARGQMRAAPGHALDDLGIVDGDLDHEIELDTGILHRVGLRDGAWKAVEQKAFAAIRLADAFLDHADDDVVRHQRAGVHDFFRRHAECRAVFYVRPQHVTGRYLRNAEFFLDVRRLGAFAGAGPT